MSNKHDAVEMMTKSIVNFQFILNKIMTNDGSDENTQIPHPEQQGILCAITRDEEGVPEGANIVSTNEFSLAEIAVVMCALVDKYATDANSEQLAKLMDLVTKVAHESFLKQMMRKLVDHLPDGMKMKIQEVDSEEELDDILKNLAADGTTVHEIDATNLDNLQEVIETVTSKPTIH